MSRTSAERARKRRKHERVIAGQPDAASRLKRAWSWVLAELKHQPEHIEYAITAVTGLAQRLNEGGSDARDSQL